MLYTERGMSMVNEEGHGDPAKRFEFPFYGAVVRSRSNTNSQNF